jgi:antitoxin Phd
MDNIWQFQQAKSRLSELVERALAEGAQIVMRDGYKVVVIMPFDEYERLIRPSESLTQFWLAPPMARSGLVIERDKSSLPSSAINPPSLAQGKKGANLDIR